jgi:hypothetical protein
MMYMEFEATAVLDGSPSRGILGRIAIEPDPSLRPCLLVRYFWGSQGIFPAHPLIPENPAEAVYF